MPYKVIGKPTVEKAWVMPRGPLEFSLGRKEISRKTPSQRKCAFEDLEVVTVSGNRRHLMTVVVTKYH